MNLSDRISPTDVEEGETYTFAITSNVGRGGRRQVTVTNRRDAPNDPGIPGDVSRIDARTPDGDTLRVYWPNAHVEDTTDGVESIGRLTGIYPAE